MKKLSVLFLAIIIAASAFPPQMVMAEEASPSPGESWASPYRYVKEGDWFYGGVRFSDERELIDPLSEFVFDTESLITRAALVAALGRLAGVAEDYDLIGESPFEDVSRDHIYRAYISWASDHDIVTGFSDGTFKPEDPVTREQMCAVIVRFSSFMGLLLVTPPEGVDPLDAFQDKAQISGWAKSAVAACCVSGIFQGKATGFDPMGGARRCEAALILMRYYDNFMK